LIEIVRLQIRPVTAVPTTVGAVPPSPHGLLVVGHGSRRAEANAALRSAAEALTQPVAGAGWGAVQHAFLELSDPGIEDAYGQLVAAGCTTIVVSLFFLFPGAHTMTDIPAQLGRAADRYPGARWVITEPLGLHPAVLQAARARIAAVQPSE
jgi:sirohydrochlorin ferrochelatase